MLAECFFQNNKINMLEFKWDFKSDLLSWNGNTQQFFEVDPEQINNGKEFAKIMSSESQTIFNSLKNNKNITHEILKSYNTNFAHSYCIYPNSNILNGRVWVECFGTLILDDHNLPALACGVMRIAFAKQTTNMNCNFVHLLQNDMNNTLGQRMFHELLEESFEDAKVTKKPLAICVLSLTNLNEINEQYGFEISDELLAKVIEVLRQQMRKRDFIYRISGNKFAIILHNCTDKSAHIAYTRFLNTIVSITFDIFGHQLKTGILCGVYVAPGGAQNAHEAINIAKGELIEAKYPINKGFNCYNTSMERNFNAKKLKDASEQILLALNERRIELAFQPIMNAQGQDVWFYEALVRLRMPDGKLLGAAAFVPIAEKLGLMELIDYRVLELALLVLEEHDNIILSVNITPNTTHSQDWMMALKAKHNANPNIMNRLIIELTESAVVDNLEWCRSFLVEVKSLGCLAAIDDFGAGYTSFRYLREFDVDIVKIDGGYIMNLTNSLDDQSFVKTLLTLSKNLGLKVVAEWVTNNADADLLRSWNVDGLQGEYATMPVSNLIELLGIEAKMMSQSAYK